MSQTMKQDPMLLGLVLIVGAMLYSRQSAARAATGNSGAPRTVPASEGSGTNQVLGGILGALFRQSPSPNYWGQYQTPGYIGTTAAQEIDWNNSSPDVVVPAEISTTGEEQIWTVG